MKHRSWRWFKIRHILCDLKGDVTNIFIFTFSTLVTSKQIRCWVDNRANWWGRLESQTLKLCILFVSEGDLDVTLNPCVFAWSPFLWPCVFYKEVKDVQKKARGRCFKIKCCRDIEMFKGIWKLSSCCLLEPFYLNPYGLDGVFLPPISCLMAVVSFTEL